MKPICVLACALMAVLLICGCSQPPQVTPSNRNLIDGLRTATSSEQIEWVEDCAKTLEEAKSKGTVTDQEYAEFQTIIRLAREKKWDEAESLAIRLGKAQKPTAEELDRAKARQKPAG